MLSVPSVATIAGTRRTVTMNPLIIPRTSPMPIPNRIAPGGVEHVVLERHGDAVGDEAHHRLDRQVDVPGDDHERLADRGHGHDRGEDRDLRDVVDRQELGRGERDEGAQDDHDRHEAELALAGEHAEPRAALARSGEGRGHALSHRSPPCLDRVGREVAGRGEHHPLLGRVGAGDLGGDATLVEDEDPVGHREDLGQVARDEDDPEARRGQLGDDPVDLDLGADVDAAGRLVEDQQARLRGQPFGEDDLLLVAARQRADHLLDAGHLDVELVGVVARDLALPRRVHEEPREEARQDRQRHVLGDREIEDEALLVAVLGQVGDARVHRGRWAGEADGPAVQPDLAAIALVDAEQDPGDLRPAGADEPGQPDDLAVPDVEGDVAEDAGPGQALDLEEDLADRRLDLGEERHAPADHVPDEVGGREVGRRRRDDVLAVAEDRRPVAQLEHLVEPVADEQDRDAAGAQVAGRS